MNNVINVEVAFDFICPWCYIGKRQLERALKQLHESQPELSVEVRWHGVQLLPTLPTDGTPFQAFYQQRLGSQQAVAARQEQIRFAASTVNLTLNFDKIELMPNTARVHRLFAAAQAQLPPQRVQLLMEAIYRGYFVEGADIGNIEWLWALASEENWINMKKSDLSGAYYQSEQASWFPRSVPAYRFSDGKLLYGANSVDDLVNALADCTTVA